MINEKTCEVVSNTCEDALRGIMFAVGADLRETIKRREDLDKAYLLVHEKHIPCKAARPFLVQI